MEQVQFVLEAPHLPQGHKKRPRLVTSCDNCRLRKIKCIMPSGSKSACEACHSTHTQCLFRDRERYFAERSRALSGTNPEPSSRPAKGQGDQQPPNRSPEASPSHDAPPQTLTNNTGPSRTHSISRSASYHPYHASSTADSGVAAEQSTSHHYVSDPELRSSASSHALFDTKYPDWPSSNLMVMYIQMFFDNLNESFPFLAYDETMRMFFERTLPAVLSNCIAALAARYTSVPETVDEADRICDMYCNKAKILLSSDMQRPSMETLHALILVSWIEYKRHRAQEFYAYGQMAVNMAAELGLTDGRALQTAHGEYDHTVIRSTWTSVFQLELSIKARENEKHTAMYVV